MAISGTLVRVLPVMSYPIVSPSYSFMGLNTQPANQLPSNTFFGFTPSKQGV